MKTSLWIVVVAVSGIVGFLVGYSVSSSTGTRSVEKAQAYEEEKVAPHPREAPKEAPSGPASPAGGYATGEAASPMAAPGGPPPGRTAVPKKASAVRSPKKPAGAKATSGGPSQGPASAAGGY